MKRNLVLKVSYIFVAVVIIAGAFFYIYNNLINADQINSDTIVDARLDLGGGELEKVRLEIGVGDKIKVYKSFFSSCDSKISGFEREAQVSAVVGGNNKMIKVAGPVGVHAENIQFFMLDAEGCPKSVGFEKNGKLDYNIYSDQPAFQVQDFNSDGYTDVASEWRDYDQDPLSNGFRDIYLFDQVSSTFKFESREVITHTSS